MNVQITFPRDFENEYLFKLPRKGQWNVWNGDVIVNCPSCGNKSNAKAHVLRQSGYCDPSFVCGHKDCSYHEYIKLEDTQVPVRIHSETVVPCPS